MDGSDPNHRSQLYKNPVSIDGSNANNHSFIPSTPLDGPDHLYKFIWLAPKEVSKNSIIRFALFKHGFRISPIYSKTYFVQNNFIDNYSLPVISLITDSLNLFDFNTGIYVPGKKHEEDGFNYWALGNYHNRGVDWERDIHITYFNANKKI